MIICINWKYYMQGRYVMKRRFVGVALLLVLLIALSGCGGQGAATSQNTPKDGGNSSAGAPSAEGAASAQQEDAGQAITTFSVKPVDGWTLLESSSDTFKSYNLLEPYVGSANFWIRYFGIGVFSGTEQDARAALRSVGFSDYEFASVEKLEYTMPVVRCVTHATIQGMKFTLGHYFIDAPGDEDIYFQLSTAPENFDKAQSPWEEALHTLTVE